MLLLFAGRKVTNTFAEGLSPLLFLAVETFLNWTLTIGHWRLHWTLTFGHRRLHWTLAIGELEIAKIKFLEPEGH